MHACVHTCEHHKMSNKRCQIEKLKLHNHCYHSLRPSYYKTPPPIPNRRVQEWSLNMLPELYTPKDAVIIKKFLLLLMEFDGLSLSATFELN